MTSSPIIHKFNYLSNNISKNPKATFIKIKLLGVPGIITDHVTAKGRWIDSFYTSLLLMIKTIKRGH